MNELFEYKGELYLRNKPNQTISKVFAVAQMLNAGWSLATRVSDGELTFVEPLRKLDELYCAVWVRGNKIELTGVFKDDIDILYDIWIDLAPGEKAGWLYYNVTQSKVKVEHFSRTTIPWLSTKGYIEGFYKNV